METGIRMVYLSGLRCSVHLWRRARINNRGRLAWGIGSLHKTLKLVNICSDVQDYAHVEKTSILVLTCVSPGDWAGWGTEGGPVIGCGGLFISCGSA